MNPINSTLRGFSLVELSIAMAVVAILTAAAAPVAIRSLEIKAGEKTALEISTIQEAARNYYAQKGMWPATLTQMKSEGYLNQNWQAINPWQNPYLMTTTSSLMTVTTDVPVNMRAMVASRLPLATISGSTVLSVVSPPGSSSGVARGVIVAWSGTIGNIPSGWALCDGGNGTPDLRDKFIIGARQDESGMAKTNVMGSLSQSGGTISHSHGGSTASHTLTVAEIPSHQHASWGEAFIELAPWGVTGGRGQLGASNSDRDNYFYNTSPTGGGQGHAHPISIDYHLPPYFALAFIMKL